MMPNYKAYKTVLTIAGSDSSGGAGIQADLKTISALGCYGTSAITSLTAQNTLGVQSVLEIESAFVSEQIRSILSDIKTDAIKIGMLFNESITCSVHQELLPWEHLPIILDPVMIATSGDLLIKPQAINALKEKLFPLCELITPNIHEAQVLSGITIISVEDMQRAAVIISQLGIKNVLIKGGDRSSPLAIDILYTAATSQFHYFENSMVETSNTHGTGCTLSSAIASFRAQGENLILSVKKAKTYVYEAIQAGKHDQIGNGNGPISHFYKTRPLA